MLQFFPRNLPGGLAFFPVFLLFFWKGRDLYFLNYYLYNSDVTIELEKNKVDVHFSHTESFKVTLIDTGIDTNTAGRIKRIQKYIGNESFMLTYGDGLANIDIKKLIEHHNASKRFATLTSIQIPGRFGHLDINENGIVGKFHQITMDYGLMEVFLY